jgi:hypothetical protein
MTQIPPRVRNIVLTRDTYRCIAPVLDPKAGQCRDTWGNVITRWPAYDRGPQYLQMSHTKEEGELSLQKKARSDPEHLVTLCPFHHTGTVAGSNWEAVNRGKIRRHLKKLYPARYRT